MFNQFDMKLTQKLAYQYKFASKKDRSSILSNYCHLTNISRNTASKRFNSTIKSIYPKALPINLKTKKGRKPKYTSIHKSIIKKCWALSDNICAERLHPMLDLYLEQLRKNNKLNFFGYRYIQDVKSIPLGSLKYILKSFLRAPNKKYKSKNPILSKIPIQANFAQFSNKLGFIGLDYVEHNGGNSSGPFAITGTYADIYSQWTVRASALNKSEKSVSHIHNLAVAKIYHPIIEIHPDNSSPVLKMLFDMVNNPNNKRGIIKQNFKLSRSRPYKKEDNAHVEQKNGDKVRKEVGYLRYDTLEEVNILNKFYDLSDKYNNFFIPSMKLIKTERDGLGRVVKKTYDKPKTPYQRLLRSTGLSKETKDKLREVYNSLNMVKLREEMNTVLEELFNIYSRKFRGK